MKLTNVTFHLNNDGVHDTAFNMTQELFVDVQKVKAIVNINMQENDEDQEYRRLFFKTTLDYEKLFNGVYGNYFSRALMANFFKSIDFEVKFPFRKV